MRIVQCLTFGTAWADAAGQKNPPSAPPAIPPIIITPVNRIIQIPPAVDPFERPPGPPVLPPGIPLLRM
jgi:hypothetical protein